ncbi:MAG: hypothetical protein H7Z41_12495, partial [Cytophagales bacterium]|nr:hypothetical protein [Armatimonadota bacterium]
VLTTLFALLVMAAGLLLRHKTEGVRFAVDAVLFLVFLVLNAIGGLTARVS